MDHNHLLDYKVFYLVQFRFEFMKKLNLMILVNLLIMRIPSECIFYRSVPIIHTKPLFGRENLKWGASSRWSFRPNSAWGSIETTTIRETHPALLTDWPFVNHAAVLNIPRSLHREQCIYRAKCSL